jgi:hypothetical protein
VRQFTELRAPLLAVSVTDDEYGTVPAIERLLGYFTGSAVTHLRIAPQAIGVDAIGHFAFFHSRFEASLWRIALAWLKTGEATADMPGRIIMRRDGVPRHLTGHVAEHETVEFRGREREDDGRKHPSATPDTASRIEPH